MISPWVQMATLVGLTHGFRGLGRALGPHRCGLLMGLPSTTALVLLWTGLEGGPDEAARAAQTCLLGLVASAALPLLYHQGLAVGCRLPWLPGLACAGYLGMALALRLLPEPGPAGCVGVAALGLTALCRLASDARGCAGDVRAEPRRVAPGTLLAYRTALPVAYLLALRALREWGGPGLSSLFITFPGASLTVLVATHLEAGPGTAGRLARAMPRGTFSTFAFLIAFRFGGPAFGVGCGTGLAVAAALLTALGLEAGRDRRERPSLLRAGLPRLRLVPGWGRTVRLDPLAGSLGRPRRGNRLGCFSPRIECLAG